MALVTNQALNELKCSVCTKYLSYLPIYLNKNTLQPLCGRCSKTCLNEDHIQDKTYENLIQHLKFPCIFDNAGCIETLSPTEIPNHESNCPYRKISCLGTCEWQGLISDVVGHVEEYHSDRLLRNNEFEMSLLSSYENYNFLTKNGELFLFRHSYETSENKLKCYVLCYKLIQTKYSYEIVITNGNRSLSTRFLLDTGLDNINSVVIDIDQVKNVLNDPNILIGSVNITTNVKKPTPSKLQNFELFKEMLSELECPICYNYIIPPIFQCVTGHSVCEDCKTNISICPTCRGEIRDTQNFTLEKVASLLTYPCRFSVYGCEFTAKPLEVKRHQINCMHGPHYCPLKDFENCSWENSAQHMYEHILDCHQENILDYESVTLFLTDDYFDRDDAQCYIKILGKQIFKVDYKYSRGWFYWRVNVIGVSEETGDYTFDINIVDNQNNGRKLFLRSNCFLAEEHEEIYYTSMRYVKLHREQLKPFLTDQFTYFICITQKSL